MEDKKYIFIQLSDDEAGYYDHGFVEIEEDDYYEDIIITGNKRAVEFGSDDLIEIIKGDYYADDVGYDYAPMEELEKVTGKKYTKRAIHGYSQGDWNYIYYPENEFRDEDIDYIETMYFGKYDIFVSEDAEDDYDLNTNVVYVPHDVVWQGVNGIKHYIADIEDLDPSDIVIRRFKGYKKTPESEVDEDCNKTEKITEGVKKTVKYAVPEDQFIKGIIPVLKDCGFQAQHATRKQGYMEFDVVGDSDKQDCWNKVDSVIKDINQKTNVSVTTRLKFDEADAQTAVLEKAEIKVRVYLDSAGAIEEALPSGNFEDKYDDQTIEEWYDFVSDVEALIERNGEIVNTSNSKHADSLSTYIDFYKVDKDGNREDGLVDLRISDHKATSSARINRKRKAQKIDSNVIFKTIVVNNKVFNSYEEALEYLEKVILKFNESLKESKEELEVAQEIFTPEEQEEYNCDEEGNCNDGYDVLHHCGWCDDVFTEYEMRKEAHLGWLCPRCVAAIWSRGEKLNFEESLKEKKEDLKESEDTMDNKEQVKEFIKKSVEALEDGSATNCRLKLDDHLAIFVGWSEGFGDEIRDDVIQDKEDPDYGIVAGVKVWTSDDMWTDFDYLNFPYYEDGDTLDFSTSITPEDRESNFDGVADYLLKCYEDVKDLELEDDGKIIEEEEVEVEESCKSKKKSDKKLKESDAPDSLEDCQKWVDYDMKKYGKISGKTNDLVKKAGFQVVKDKYGDWEVIAGKYDESCGKKKSKKMQEAFRSIAVDEVFDDIIDRAISKYKDGADKEDALTDAIDDGLIYTDDIFTLAKYYLNDSDIINQFYDDFYSDIYQDFIDALEDEEEDEEEEEVE